MTESPQQIFFASYGRMGRAPFVGAAMILLALFGAYEALVGGAAHLATGWLAHLLLLTAAVSVTAKRLHDRGRSGWWAAVVVGAFLAAWPRPEGMLDGVATLVLAVAAIDLAILPGARGFNAFGPPPG